MTLIARGAVTDRPWGLTFGALGVRGLTGELAVVTDGKTYRVAFSQGAIVAAHSPLASDAAVRIALTGNLITSTQVADITRRMAAAPDRDEIDLLAEIARLAPDQAQRLRRRLIANRAARAFSLDHGTFTVDDQFTLEMFEGSELDVRAVCYLGAKNNFSEERMGDELRALGGWFQLKAEAIEDLPQFGFTEAEKPALQMLRQGADVGELEQNHASLGPRAIRAVLYALVSCGACEIQPPRQAPRSGPSPMRAPGQPAPAQRPPGQPAPAVSRAPTPVSPVTSRTPSHSSVPSPVGHQGSGAVPSAARDSGSSGVPRPTRDASSGGVPRLTRDAVSSGVPSPAGNQGSSSVASPAGNHGSSGVPRPTQDAASSGVTSPPTRTPIGSGVPSPVANQGSAAYSSGTRPQSSTVPQSPRARTPSMSPGLDGSRAHTPTPQPIDGEPSVRMPTGQPMEALALPTQRPGRPHAAPPRRAKRNTASTNEIEQLLANKVPLLANKADHYTLFGVQRNATADEIRNTYYMLARKLHPDRLSAIGVVDEARDAQHLMAQINAAFAVLNDPAKRAEYTSILDRGGESVVRAQDAKADEMAMRIMRAEEAFRLGEMALRRDQIAQAVESFKIAVELQPNEVEYQALLAWAQFAAATDKVALAMQTRKALLRAAEANDRSPTARFYLGRVERMLGKEREALQHFKEVLRIKPSHSEAASEARVLESRLKR